MEDNLASLVLGSGLSTRLIGRDLRYYEVVSSTNEVAKDLAREGASEGTVLIANYQSAGRGRLGRTWLASPGSGLLVSVVLRPSLEELNVLTMAGALAMVHAIEAQTGLRASIKWPNDVEIGGKKLCGILVETEVERGNLHFAILGAGLNVSFDTSHYPEIAQTATSLVRELGRGVARAALLRGYLESLEQYYLASRRGTPVWQEWRDRLETLGKWVRLISGDSVTEGMAETVDPSGKLYIRQANGQIATALAGEVTLRRAKPPTDA